MGQVRFFAPFCPPSARVLEIGCATGELAAAVRKELSPARYEAIELSPAGEQALPHLDRLHKQPLRELISSNTIDGGFDLILMSHVLEHLADPAAELAAMLEVLAGNGAIFLEVPNGGGHRLLPIDDNGSHLHFFSTSSLCRLLSNLGVETVAAETGARLDARYADSLRVAGRVFSLPKWSSSLLSNHSLFQGEDKIVVWGAGSLAAEMLANFFDMSAIEYFIDKDPGKQGKMVYGRPVRPPEALGTEPRTILINSIDFAPAILSDIRRLYPDTPHKFVSMAELLDNS